MHTILIIDDDLTTRLLLENVLQKQGYKVFTADNGADGLRLARQLQPALIISDWVMEDIDGLEVCRQVKADPQLNFSFFILLTLRQSTEDCIQGLNAGADEFLAKPIAHNELRARVRAGLRLYQASLDLQKRNQKLEQLSQDLHIQTQTLQAELKEAATYIESLLPAPLSGEIRSEICFIPSSELGGDCFDHYWLDSERLIIYLLDVAGHGLAAALPSISVFNLLRTRSLPNVDFAQPHQVLTALNKLDLFHGKSKYFTIWYGVYYRSSRQLVYASAGHPPAILVSQQTEMQPLKTPNIPLCLFPDQVFEQASHIIEPNSNLYIFSDGIYEVLCNSATETKDPMAFHQWVNLLTQSQNQSIDQLATIMLERSGQSVFNDDVSVVALQFS
jgi:phosphoserine phosphatase RsbU/P